MRDNLRLSPQAHRAQALMTLSRGRTSLFVLGTRKASSGRNAGELQVTRELHGTNVALQLGQLLLSRPHDPTNGETYRLRQRFHMRVCLKQMIASPDPLTLVPRH